MRKLSIWIVLLLTAVLLGSVAVAAEVTQEDETAQVTGLPGMDSDQLFYRYLLRQAGAGSIGLVPRGTVGRVTLSGLNLTIYDLLKEKITGIASGKISSTEMSITLEEAGVTKTSWTQAELGTSIVENGAIQQEATSALMEKLAYDAPAVVNALLADCPYDLYWFDKTKGYSYGYGGFSAQGMNGEYVLGLKDNVLLQISFTVAEAYREADYTVSSTKIAEMQVEKAVENARRIVNNNSGKLDAARLYAYRDAICDLVEYNHSAADDDSTPYGNPWQLIYVFDGDDSTNVVCEGYSKAFQFLCDLTSFNNQIVCYSVTGTMAGGEGAGPHMWNLVRMEDGNSYLVDVTNCDGNSIGASYELFLKGMTLNNDEGTSYFRTIGGSRISYIYDEDTTSRWSSSVLKPSETDYTATVNEMDAWLDEWEFELADGICMLKKQTGTATEIEIPGTAWIDGQNYQVVMESKGLENYYEDDSTRMFVTAMFNRNVTSIRMHGVKLTGNCACMFSGLTKCKSIILDVDTTSVTSMSSMFFRCSSLTELDISSFDTANVITMPYMFRFCSALPELDLSSFDTRNVEDMDWMFGQCEALTMLDLSSFYTPKLQDMSCMFDECVKLQKINMPHVTTAAVNTMYGTFRDCKSLEEVERGFWNTANVQSMHQMLRSCSALRTFDVSGFDTSKVTSFAEMFEDCGALEEINVSNFDTSSATQMYRMFVGCRSAKTLDVSKFDTSKVTGGLDCMFCSCASVTRLDVSGFDTSFVTSMAAMFYGCSELTELDVSGFDTSNVTDMSSMFCECSKLKSLDVSHFNTSNVTSMNRMFAICGSLDKLDLKSFDTRNVSDMQYMFQSPYWGSPFNGYVEVGENFVFYGDESMIRAFWESDNNWYSATDRTWYTPNQICGRSCIADIYLTSLDILEYGEPEYTWTEDYTSVTAVVPCEPISILSEEETVAPEVTETEPTCTKDGARVYTAVFTSDVFNTQTETVELPALGHGEPVLSVTLATSEKDGAKADTCPRCGEMIGNIQIIHHTHVLTIPRSTKTIETEAFEGAMMEQVTLSMNVESIGSRAFAECGNLLAVRIPAELDPTNIADDAFSGDTNVVLIVETDELEAYCVRNSISYIRIAGD